MRLIPAILASTVLLTLPTVAAAQQQSDFERQVRQQLDKIGESLKKQNYELTHQVYTGALKEEASEAVAIRLRRGVQYAIVGVCDQDRADIDMRVVDPSEKEVGRDAEPDDTPVVEFAAGKTGEYVVQLEMAECADQPCAFGVGVFAVGQDEFERQVREQIETAGKDLEAKGFMLTHQIFTGALKQGEGESVAFDLDKGATYVVLGVCDADCKDLDLKLLDDGGKELDSDVEEDDVPVVAATTTRKGDHVVQAVMAACSSSPCRYGLGVFRK